MNLYTEEHLQLVYRAATGGISWEDVVLLLKHLDKAGSELRLPEPERISPETRQRLSSGMTRLEKVIFLLNNAGPDGMHRADLAKALKVEQSAMDVWLQANKNGKGFRRVRPGVYSR